MQWCNCAALEVEFVGADAVLSTQEPARKTLLHRMKSITDYGLKHLGEQSVRVPSEEIAQRR